MTEFGDAASSSSSSFTYRWPYHVFLSFRGEDTRQGFTGHLYNALHKRGIRTFLDDQGIRKGEDITPTLLKTIEESKTAIVVFSKNYASSTFCLTELVQILHCMKGRNGRFIWPVFYDVDPSDIRHQTGSYKDAFDQHERVKDEKIVKLWRLALTEAANMSGWHFELEPRSKSYEYEMMEEIIGVVSKEISTGPLHIVQFSVGLESRVKEVCSLLNKQPHFDGATMVGICGIGGIGKTTIVRAVYNTIAGQFQYSCFLSNIKEKSIQDLQEILLSETIGEKDIKLNYDKRGIPIIKDRLQNKKVLLILDDIDTLDQLRALAGESNWFGFGSTIIITTRDRSLLKNHEVERLYEVKELTCEEARQLLILNAFKNKEANPGYAKVIQRAVEYASGLPLVLEILGSNFHICQTIEEWETALDIYEKIPDKTVQKILKVSYDGLGEKQREIFLDIACFYRGQPLEDATKILSASHDIGVEFCIRELIEKSLIKIDDDSYLDMHDLIQDMGQEIVRQESPIDVGRRSRLWSSKDILHVLKENTGTATIQAMNLLFNFKGKEVEWSGEAFEKMKNLRLLSFCRGVMFSQGPKCLPNSLRVVQWDDYPSSTLPDDFCPINLVILRLRYSHLKTLGKAFKNFNNLRQLNLGFSKDLKEIPDISGAVNLEELEVSYCQKLTKIDDSVGRLTKLRMLNAQRCISLDSFIVKGMELVSLEVLNLSYCFELHTFPKILVPMKNIKTFDMSHTAIKTLPESIEKLDALERLSNNYHRFDQPDLRTLYLVNCLQLQEIREVPPNIKIFSLTSSSIRTLLKQNCCNLRELDLSYNKNLEEFPDISEAVNLEVLDVSYCKKLTKIDDSVGHFAKLRILNAKKCINLDTFIVKGIKLVSLEILNLSNCSNLHIFPEILVTMEKIETLDLSYTAIKILPESIEKLIALETLCLSDSTELRQLPNLACRNLKRLDLNGCKKLEEIKGISQDIEVFSAKNCTSLTSCTTRLLLRQKFFNLCKLNLQGCESLEELPDIFEAANLQELNVSHCKKLTKINDSIGHLAKLKVLNAEGCEMLDTFIVGGIMLVSLEILNLRCCYKLHTFPKILGTMENIVILDLGHTAITLLPESMEKLVALERLLLREIKGDLSDDRNPFRFDESTLYLDGCDQLQEIRKIPPNIKVFFAENCKSLTSSCVRTLLKQKIFNLCELTLQDCENLEELPDISGAANLKKLNVGYCKKLTKIDDSVGHLNKLKVLNAEECRMLDTFIVGGIKLVSLEILILRRCYKLHTFPEILETMEKIKTLDLSHTAIKTLPKSIENFVALEALYLSSCKELRQLPNLACYHNLKTLDLDLCKELKEIKGISPDIEVFSAKNCTSLTSCTTRLLLRQTRRTEFIMPGNEIPKWLHKHSTGGSVSFLVRRKFPQIALCAVVTGGPTIFSSFVMHINGVTKYVVSREKIEIEIDHIFLFDLRRFKRKVASSLEALWKHTRVLRIDDVASKLLAKEWDHVKFSLESEGTESRLKYIGVYVYNYDSCKEDILFENPIPQERIQVEAVHKIGDSNLASSSRDNNEEDLSTETVSDVEKKKGQLKMDNVNLTLSLALPEPSSDTTSHYDLQQQQQLTCINQKTSESFEIVGKAKGKGIIVHVGDANEEKDKNAFEVTYQNALRSSNGSLTLDPMIGKYGSTRQKDQSTIIDEGHDGCDPMEWEYQFTHPKDESIIIDLQLQQQLTSINQQISESSEIVKEAKGKDIMVHGGNADEIKDKNAFEVTCQNWDPMIWQYGSTRKKDQSTIIDEGHDGCDRMEWEYQFTPWKDQSTIIDEGHDGCGPMEWESQFTHPKDQSTIIADKLDKEIMDLSTKTVSNIEKKGQLMVDDVNLTLSLALPEPSNDTTSHHDLQQQQDLSCINHEILDCSENVQKGGNIFEVSWDAVEIHGESTIIDEGHDGRGSPYSKDLQQQQQLTSINQQTSESFDVVEKAKGKGIIVHGGNANEEKDKNALEKDQSTINDKGLDELGSHKARATCFDLLCCLVSLCSSSAAS